MLLPVYGTRRGYPWRLPRCLCLACNRCLSRLSRPPSVLRALSSFRFAQPLRQVVCLTAADKSRYYERGAASALYIIGVRPRSSELETRSVFFCLWHFRAAQACAVLTEKRADFCVLPHGRFLAYFGWGWGLGWGRGGGEGALNYFSLRCHYSFEAVPTPSSLPSSSPAPSLLPRPLLPSPSASACLSVVFRVWSNVVSKFLSQYVTFPGSVD